MKRIRAFLLVATASVVAPACDPGVDNPGDGDGSNNPDDPNNPTDEWNKKLEARVYDYNAALRIAALRLTGDLPTATEMNTVATAVDDAAKKVAYEALVDNYIARPTFARQMMIYFRDTFRMGGTLGQVDLETAPAFAASLAVNNDSYMKLLTATADNCTTFNGTTFTAATCANGVTAHAGVLTNPGMLAQFDSNLAFRRVRWVQETFNCQKHPAEFRATPETRDGKLYTSAFAWESLATNKNGGAGRIDFLDTSGVTCANCHGGINHMAPLFARFNPQGVLQANVVVKTPLAPPNDVARLSDFLVNGEPTAYRLGQNTADLPALGAAMAADSEVQACAVKRFWNWALGRQDIVNDLELVPDTVIQKQIDDFKANGFKTKDLIRAIFVADDFTKF